MKFENEIPNYIRIFSPSCQEGLGRFGSHWMPRRPGPDISSAWGPFFFTRTFTTKNPLHFHFPKLKIQSPKLLGPLSHNVFRSSETQEPRERGFSKRGFCRVQSHAQPSWGGRRVSGYHPAEPDMPKLSWLHCTVQLGSRCDCAETTMTYGASFLEQTPKQSNQAPNYTSKTKFEKYLDVTQM